MATADDLRTLALALPGTVERPHMDRAAFAVDRIFVTLGPDGQTANFRFTPDEQVFKCQLAPDVFVPIPNGWGRRGWTTALLHAASKRDLAAALQMAHAHAVGGRKRRR